MDDKKFRFTGFNPILSFSEGSIGFKSENLIGLNEQTIDAPSHLWRIGFKAFKYFLFKPSGETDISLHEANTQEIIKFFESTYDHLWKAIEEKKIIPTGLNGDPISDIESINCRSIESKAFMVESISSQMDTDGNLGDVLPHFYFAYLSMKVIDDLCALDLWHVTECDVGIDSDINKAERLLNIVEKYDAIERIAKLKAKSAANTRHKEKTYKVKEELRAWHKNNRHEFLKNDGSLHQADAAEHVCYVLKITTLKAKKVAEYMGEFEKDLKK